MELLYTLSFVSFIYTTETYEGKRVQKFLYQGMRPVTVRDRAPTWPASEL